MARPLRSQTSPLRFRRSVVRDLRNRIRFALVGLLILIGLHAAAMVAFEGLDLGEAVWLTFTTITTTGYGDLSAKTLAGRASTIVLIYLSGIFLLTQAGGAFFEFRILRRERKRRGEWRWDMRDHIVFVNAPADEPGDYLRRLLNQLHRSHANFANVSSLILTEAFPDGLPPDLEDDPRIVQLKGRFDDPAALEAAGVDHAQVLVILAEQEGDRLSDSRTFDIIHRLRERGITARIVAECVDDLNRDRLKRAGASAIVRPLRGYPEMIVRAIVAPGTEWIVERLFSSEGDECLRFDVTLQGMAWSDVVSTVLEANYGTPVGYADAQGQPHSNPPPHAVVTAEALFVLVDETQRPTNAALRNLLDTRLARTKA
ncbi:potassium channel family protein [Methylobacterium sp. WL116]|uniref:potassium channel family protein n=1 Tax=Methylobacterium sp. WL116 TaxID=2603889 RepID=UPI0011CBACB5|nr:potassium channel family protein [Methylobacterium sp. WL116]TXM94080.1 ion transporter [Methylobacterium sp. WL116]